MNKELDKELHKPTISPICIKYDWDELGESYKEAALNLEKMCDDLGEEPRNIPSKLFPGEYLDSVIEKYKALALDCQKAVELQKGPQRPFLLMENQILLKLQALGYGKNQIAKIDVELFESMKNYLENTDIAFSLTVGCKKENTKEFQHCAKNYPYDSKDDPLEVPFLKKHVLDLGKDAYTPGLFFSITLHDAPEAGADLTYNFYDQFVLKFFEGYVGKANVFKLIILEDFTIENLVNPQTWRILQKFCAEGAKVIINNYNYVSFRELSEENQEGLFGLFHSVFPDRKTSNTEIELLKKSGILTLEKSKKIHNEKTTIEKYTYQVTEDKQEYLYLIPDKENPKAMQGALQWTKKEHENHFIIKRAPVFNKFVNKFGFSSEVFFDENDKFVPRMSIGVKN